MKSSLAAGLVGFIFAVGLALAGMTQPQKVVGFLDVTGNWDASLIFVMAGAVLVHYFTYKWVRKRKTPLFSDKWHIPTSRKITPALALGSLFFGVGWGLAGFCPGPALTSLASLDLRSYLFVGSMLFGMFFYRKVDSKLHFLK